MIAQLILRLGMALFFFASGAIAWKGELSVFGLQGMLAAALFFVVGLIFLTRLYIFAALFSTVYFGITIYAVLNFTIAKETAMFFASLSLLLPWERGITPARIVTRYRDLLRGKYKP